MAHGMLSWLGGQTFTKQSSKPLSWFLIHDMETVSASCDYAMVGKFTVAFKDCKENDYKRTHNLQNYCVIITQRVKYKKFKQSIHILKT